MPVLWNHGCCCLEAEKITVQNQEFPLGSSSLKKSLEAHHNCDKKGMGQHSENWTEKEAIIGQMINQLVRERHLKK